MRKIKLSLPRRKEMLELIGRHTQVKAFDNTLDLKVGNTGIDKLFAAMGKEAAGLPSERK